MKGAGLETEHARELQPKRVQQSAMCRKRQVALETLTLRVHELDVSTARVHAGVIRVVAAKLTFIRLSRSCKQTLQPQRVERVLQADRSRLLFALWPAAHC